MTPEEKYKQALDDLNRLSEEELREKYCVFPSGAILLNGDPATFQSGSASRAPAPETAGLVGWLTNHLREAGYGAQADALTAMQARLDDVTAERDAARKKLWGENDLRRQLANMQAVAEDRTGERDALQEQLAQAREAGHNLRSFVSLFAGGDEVMHLSVREWDALIPSPTRSTEDGA